MDAVDFHNLANILSVMTGKRGKKRKQGINKEVKITRVTHRHCGWR